MKIVGIGAGGHARVLINILKCMGGFEIIGLTDVRKELWGSSILGIQVMGGDELLAGFLDEEVKSGFVGIGGIGDNRPRALVFEKMLALGFDVVNAIHPSSILAKEISIGRGNAVMAGAVINPGVVLGDDVIINTGAVVDHDCIVKDHVHIGPKAVLCGEVRIESFAHIGVGAVILQRLFIGEGAVIGAGAVVLHDVPAGKVVVGNPARSIE